MLKDFENMQHSQWEKWKRARSLVDNPARETVGFIEGPPTMNGESAYFLSINRNKKSIVINLKSEEGREIINKLIERSDIIVENFRPGVPEKLGISYDDARRIRPDIIYSSISGFGYNGSFRDRSGFDLSVMAFSGLMSITGEPGGRPVKFGVPIVDIVTGMFAAISILAALRYRDITGKGQFIDTAMIDSAVQILTHQATYYFATGRNPERTGSAHASIAPYQAFRTRDGYIVVTAGTQKIWENLCKAIGMQDLIADERFRTNEARVKNRNELESLLEGYFTKRNTDDLYKILTEFGVPCSPVNSIGQALESEEVSSRNMVVELTSRLYGTIKTLGTPLKMDKSPGRIYRAPPALGEDTMEIIRELGYSGNKIKELLDKKIIMSSI